MSLGEAVRLANDATRHDAQGEYLAAKLCYEKCVALMKTAEVFQESFRPTIEMYEKVCFAFTFNSPDLIPF
jgi:hypothetical protein